MRCVSPAFMAALLVGCAVESGVSNETLVQTTHSELPVDISDTSCPDGVPFELPAKISINAIKIDQVSTGLDPFKHLSFVAGFELNSDDRRLGGLSGLEFLDDNTLLAVSDFGDLLWIDFDRDDDGALSLSPSAYIARLKDAEGNDLTNKNNLDAEGLDWNGDRLLISFERNHRILGYDLEGCGANARGAPVLAFETAFADGTNKVDSNRGMEALASRKDGELIVGVETPGKTGPVYARHRGASSELNLNNPLPMIGAQLLTGADILADENGETLFTVHRSYDPLTGNQVSVVATDLATVQSTVLGTLKKPGVVDNFEGITVRDDNGTVQVAIISDDNFSGRQKTLLLFFDVTAED